MTRLCKRRAPAGCPQGSQRQALVGVAAAHRVPHLGRKPRRRCLRAAAWMQALVGAHAAEQQRLTQLGITQAHERAPAGNQPEELLHASKAHTLAKVASIQCWGRTMPIAQAVLGASTYIFCCELLCRCSLNTKLLQASRNAVAPLASNHDHSHVATRSFQASPCVYTYINNIFTQHTIKLAGFLWPVYSIFFIHL